MRRRASLHGRSQGQASPAPSAGIRPLEPRRAGFQDVSLEPGDVLLSLGHGEVSSAIKTLDGGKYSHAAIWSGQAVIESTTPKVVEHPLQVSLSAHPRCYIDVYRHRQANSRAEAVVDPARRFLGLPYGYGDLTLLTLLLATSKWVPTSRAQLAFLIQGCRLNELLKLTRRSKQRLVTCAGLVAKAYMKAELALRVRVSTVGRFDAKLVGQGALELLGDAKRDAASELEDEWRDLQKQLAERFTALTGFDPVHTLDASVDPFRDPKTARVLAVGGGWSPELVTPRQLEKSPDLKFCRRLYAGERPASRRPAWYR